MVKRLLLGIVVCLSLSPLIAADDNKGCEVIPDNKPCVAGDPHEITCFASPETVIISWTLGLEPRVGTNKIIYHVDIIGNIESTPHLETEGFEVGYYSLRKSAVTISTVSLDHAGYVFCCALDIIANLKYFCGSKLNVYAHEPSLVTGGINVAQGIFTNVSCTVDVKGKGVLFIAIMESNTGDASRNKTEVDLTDFTLKSHTALYQHKIAINLTKDGANRVPLDLNVTSVFYCKVLFTDSSEYALFRFIEVDAPVTFAAIVPYSEDECTERSCRLHERLVCISNGRPTPYEYVWSVMINRGHKHFIPQSNKSEQHTVESGRSIYECLVQNKIDAYTFAAAAKMTTHVEAFELVLDEFTTYESKGSKLNAWSPMTIVAAVTGIIWVVMPPRAT